MIKKNQKGSLLVEMMAVIGLLTLITPILFQQVHRRNEEIVSAQIATEMRMIKDGVQAYMEAYEDKIAQQYCLDVNGEPALWDKDKEVYKNSEAEDGVGLSECYDGDNEAIETEMENYLPGQLFEGDSNLFEEYQIRIYGYTLPTGCDAGGTCEYRPVLYAVIVEGSDSYGESLRRKVKIASLIGAEGGVAKFGANASIQGMHGSWSMPIGGENGILLEGSNSYGKYAAAIVTFFNNISSSSILKDVHWQHLDATTVQGDLIAGNSIAARNLFTVDNSDPNSSCIRNFRSRSLTIHDRKTAKENDIDCEPFFEVNPATKEVRIKEGRIMTGVGTTTFDCNRLHIRECELIPGCTWDAEALTCTGGMKTLTCTDYGANAQVCNAIPGCTHYAGDDADGNDATRCTTCGEWVTQNGCEKLAHGCAWIADDSGIADSGRCVGEYLLDPSKKSVMSNITVTNDITVRSIEGENRSLVASLPNVVQLASGISCSFSAALGGGDGANLCAEGYYASDGVVRLYSKIGTRCDCSFPSNEETDGRSCFRANKIGIGAGVNHVDYIGVVYQDSRCDSMKRRNNTTNHIVDCTPSATNPDCPTTAVSCMDYCNQLGKTCYGGDEGESVLNCKKSSATYNTCLVCASAAASCRKACLTLYPTSTTDPMNNDGKDYVSGYAVRTCYLSRGICAVKTHKNPKASATDTSDPEYACADPRSYGYSIGLQISNLDGDSAVNPAPNYSNHKWYVHFGGALGLVIGEYCVPYPEIGN